MQIIGKKRKTKFAAGDKKINKPGKDKNRKLTA